MENKKSFLLYADYVHTFLEMGSEDAGNLIKLIFEYVNDLTPDESKHGPLVKLAFIPIKQQLKRDLVKWNEIRGKRSDAGIKSAEAKKAAKEQSQQVLTSVESVQQTLTNSTVNVNDNVNGNIIKGLCDVFGITQMNNPKSFFAATYFVERLAELGKLEYFKKQIKAFEQITEPKYRGSFQKFIGSPNQNYEDGAWCAKTYEVTQEQKPKSNAERMKDIILNPGKQ